MCYLGDREQYDVMDGASSELIPIIPGVAHGSVLEPLTFYVYMNCASSLALSS